MPDSEDHAITVGDTLFLFEGDVVRVFGLDGTEATLPAADLDAFVAFLAERFAEPRTTS